MQSSIISYSKTFVIRTVSNLRIQLSNGLGMLHNSNFEVYEIPVELANLPNLPNISAKLNKIVDAKWSPPWCCLLNFSDLTIHPHYFHFWIMLVLCIIEAFNYYQFVTKKKQNLKKKILRDQHIISTAHA